MRKNRDLTLQIVQGKFVEEHYELYRHYINSRHKGGSMENPSKADYHRFLICDWSDTQFIEFRQNKKITGRRCHRCDQYRSFRCLHFF